MIEVSIIMPAYNAGVFISEAIQSVLNQNFKNWELIVVDDESTDETSLIVKQLQKNDTRIKYAYQKHGGQSRARNHGIDISKGEFIAFLDADDVWINNKLELQLKYFKSHEIDLLFSNAYIITDFTEKSVKEIGVTNCVYYGSDGLLEFLIGNRIPMLTVLLKKNILSDIVKFNEEYVYRNAEDYLLWLDLLFAGKKIHSISEKTGYYRVHKNSSSFNYFDYNESAIMAKIKHLKLNSTLLDEFLIRLYKDRSDEKILTTKFIQELENKYIFLNNEFLNYKTSLFYRIFRKYQKFKIETHQILIKISSVLKKEL